MDLLTRLSLRTLGLLPQIKPLTAPRFGPYDPASMVGPDSPDPLGPASQDREAGVSPPSPLDDRPRGELPLNAAHPPASMATQKLKPAFEDTPLPGYAKAAEPRTPAVTPGTTSSPPSDPRNNDRGASGQAHSIISRAPQKSRPDQPMPASVMDGSGWIPEETPLPPGPRRRGEPAAPSAEPHRILPQNDAATPEPPVRPRQFTLHPPDHPNQRLMPDHNGEAAVIQTPFQEDHRIPMALSDRAAHHLPIAPAEPAIQVSIGRIEVRAITPPAAPRPKLPPKAGVLTLDQYLQKRSN